MGTELVRRGREVVIPEVSRTAHLGLAGAHVQGPQAKEAFLNRALSNHTDVHLNVSMMKKDDYEEEVRELLSSAVILNITHLFSFSFPTEGGVFAVCVHMDNLFDKSAFRLVAKSLGVWSQDVREGHHGLWRLPYYRSLILILGAPYSKYYRSHNYLRGKCPVLRTTSSMEEFLDYDFESKREDVYEPQDFHSILKIPLDSERNQISFDDDSEDQSALPIKYEQNQTTPSVSQEQNQTNVTVNGEQNQPALPVSSEQSQTAPPVYKNQNHNSTNFEENQKALYMTTLQNETAFPVDKDNQSVPSVTTKPSHDTLDSNVSITPVDEELGLTHTHTSRSAPVNWNQNYTPHKESSVVQESDRYQTRPSTPSPSLLDTETSDSPAPVSSASLHTVDDWTPFFNTSSTTSKTLLRK